MSDLISRTVTVPNAPTIPIHTYPVVYLADDCIEKIVEAVVRKMNEVKMDEQLDQDREDIIGVLYSILDYARLGYEISTCDNCNNCKKKNCEYRPKLGQMVRWRCPLWRGEEG